MAKQTTFNLDKGTHGGRRTGAGRPRIHSKGASHKAREKVTARTPLHINFKLNLQVRNKERLKILKRAIERARTQGLAIIHYSLQSNHVHLIVEAVNNQTLSKGMRSLTISFAKGIKQGKIQNERYHLHVLRYPREIKNAVAYVLFNEHKHKKSQVLKVDEYTSLDCHRMARNYAKKQRLRLIWKEKGPQVLDRGKS